MTDELPGSWPDDFAPGLLEHLQNVLDEHAGDVQRQPTRHGTPSVEDQPDLSPTDDRESPDLGMVSDSSHSVASDHSLSHNDDEEVIEPARFSDRLPASGRLVLSNDSELSNEHLTDARATTITDNSVSIATHTVTDNHVATTHTHTINSIVENISTTDDHHTSTTDDHTTYTTTTSSNTSIGPARPWRVIRLPMYLLGWLFTPWSCLLVLFGIGILFVFQLGGGASIPRAWLNATLMFLQSVAWVFMAALKFALGAFTRSDTPVPLTVASPAFELSQELPKIMMIANTVALAIGNVVAFRPSAVRLVKPPESNLVGSVQDFELFLQESLFETLEEDHLTLKALLREQESISASTPVPWAMRLRGRNHYTVSVVRLEQLGSTFETILAKRQELRSRLSAGKYNPDETYGPLNNAVCAWSMNLNRLVGNEKVEDLRESSEELRAAYRHAYTTCRTVSRAWEQVMTIEGVIKNEDIPWLQEHSRKIEKWVNNLPNPIMMEDALKADRLLQDVVEQYMENLRSWYYKRPRAKRS